jgi:hypothetical protein
MKKRLIASVIGLCSLLAVATPASAGVRTTASAPSESAPVSLCLDLIFFRLGCP